MYIKKKLSKGEQLNYLFAVKRKTPQKNSSNRTDPASRYKLLNKNRKKTILVIHNLNGKN